MVEPLSLFVVGMTLIGMGFILGYFVGVCRTERYWKGKENGRKREDGKTHTSGTA